MKIIEIDQMIKRINQTGNEYLIEYENLDAKEIIDFIQTIPQDIKHTLDSYYNCIMVIVANVNSGIIEDMSIEFFKKLHLRSYELFRTPETQLQIEFLAGKYEI